MEISLEQAINLLRVEEAKTQDLSDRLNQAIALMSELKIAKATLENLPSKNTETLLPVGGGVFVPSSASRNAKILVNIGSGVVVEKTVDEAVKFLDERAKNLDKTIKEISKLLGQSARNRDVLKSKINDALRSRQGPTVVG